MNTKKSLSDKLLRVRKFITEDVWDIELASLSRARSLRIRFARILYLVLKGFRDDECPLHASALTFSTLMSIVPILAISLAVVRGLDGSEAVKKWATESVAEWTEVFEYQPSGSVDIPENQTGVLDSDTSEGSYQIGPAIEQLIEDIFKKVENVSFTALGGAGLVLLIWMVIQVLGRVESSFNRVWAASEPRPIWRKITDYLSVILILPVLIMAASSLPIVDVISRVTGREMAETIGVLLESRFLKTLMVFGMTSLSFTFLLMFMPNIKVRPFAGLIGGIVTGALFLLWLKLCANFQVAVGRYGNIYGSFAVIPILLAWVYVSWEIILFGAEVGFAVQNVTTYKMEQGARQASVHARVMLALLLVRDIASVMMGRGKDFETMEYAREQKVPIRFLNDVVNDLCKAGLLAEVSKNGGRYVLMKAPMAVRISDVAGAVTRSGVSFSLLGLSGVDESIKKLADSATGFVDESVSKTTMQELVEGKSV